MIIKNVVGLRNRVRKKLHVIMTEYEVHIMFLEKKTIMMALEGCSRPLFGFRILRFEFLKLCSKQQAVQNFLMGASIAI